MSIVACNTRREWSYNTKLRSVFGVFDRGGYMGAEFALSCNSGEVRAAMVGSNEKCRRVV